MDAPTDVTDAPGAQAPPPGPRRLRRRPDDGHIAGVCAGVAEYFNVDPVIVRIAAVVLLFSGPGGFAYVLAWIFVPEADGPAIHGAHAGPHRPQGPRHPGLRRRADRPRRQRVLGRLVVPGPALAPPAGADGAGRLAAAAPRRRSRPCRRPRRHPCSPAAHADLAPAAWAAGVGGSDATAPIDPQDDPTATRRLPRSSPTTPFRARPSTMERAASRPPRPGMPCLRPLSRPPSRSPPSSRHRRRVLGPIVFGALLVWAGVAFLADVTLETGLAGGAADHRDRLRARRVRGWEPGADPAGALVGAALAVTAVVDIPLEGPVGPAALDAGRAGGPRGQLRREHGRGHAGPAGRRHPRRRACRGRGQRRRRPPGRAGARRAWRSTCAPTWARASRTCSACTRTASTSATDQPRARRPDQRHPRPRPGGRRRPDRGPPHVDYASTDVDHRHGSPTARVLAA